MPSFGKGERNVPRGRRSFLGRTSSGGICTACPRRSDFLHRPLYSLKSRKQKEPQKEKATIAAIFILKQKWF